MRKQILFLAFMILLLPMRAWAVTVEGQGDTASEALNRAFQQAVERVVGTAIQSRTLVENGALIRDDILTHAKGYVASYTVLGQGQHAEGGYFIKMEAEVNEGMVQDHVESLEILMKMSGHPKVLVVGMDDEISSVSVLSERFRALMQQLGTVFQEKFRFRLLDRAVAESHAGRAYSAKPDKGQAIEMARVAAADIVLFVKVTAPARQASPGSRLILEAIRVSDGMTLGRNGTDLSEEAQEGSSESRESLLMTAAGERLFDTGVGLARLVVEDLQRTGERGTDYVVAFHGFPQDKLTALVPEGLSGLAGYVRHTVELLEERNARVRYWSHLSPRDLDERIAAMLKEQKIKFRRRMGGQTLEYKWKHPLFD